MLKVSRGTVNDGKTTYKPGDIISGLTEADDLRLVKEGFCVIVDVDTSAAAAAEVPDIDCAPSKRKRTK